MRAEFILLRVAAAFREPQRFEESIVWAARTDGERDPADQAQAQARLARSNRQRDATGTVSGRHGTEPIGVKV